MPAVRPVVWRGDPSQRRLEPKVQGVIPTASPAQAVAPRARGGRRGGEGVFADNRQRPIHRWYPFVEGYSSDLVDRFLAPLPLSAFVFDPFAGSGTTLLTASGLGFRSGYTEVNPYLAWVADVKVNQSRLAAASSELAELPRLADQLHKVNRRVGDHPLLEVDAARGFFPEGVAADVVRYLGWLDEELSGAALEIARLAVATSLIPCSNMVRRTDLRRRRPGDPQPLGLAHEVAERLRAFRCDIELAGGSQRPPTQQVATDTKVNWRVEGGVDMYITSPPYLNGTNYCRNTKLELLALGFIKHEAELADLRAAAVSAGINNISRRRTPGNSINAVSQLVRGLGEVAYDARIPALVQAYFADMQVALRRMRQNANEGALLALDIGDSRYCGVHVQTDRLLIEIACQEGWSFVSEEALRTRKSYDGAQLTQVLLQFKAAS